MNINTVVSFLMDNYMSVYLFGSYVINAILLRLLGRNISKENRTFETSLEIGLLMAFSPLTLVMELVLLILFLCGKICMLGTSSDQS